MTTNFLRPLTLSALAALLMTAPLAANDVSRAALQTDTAARTTAATATPFPTTLLATGARPSIAFARATKPAFLDGNFKVHRPDGTTLRLGYVALGQWSTLGRGAIGMVGTEAGPELRRINSQGTLVRDRFLTHFGLAISSDHSILSWLDDQGRPHDLEGGGSREFTLPQVAKGDSVGAVSGSTTCKEQSPEGGGCAIFVNAAHNKGAFVSTSHGIVDQISGIRHVADVSSSGRLSGLVSRDNATGRACWAVVTPNGHQAWHTCDYKLGAFSRDGRRVLGQTSQAQWDSVTSFAVFRHDGTVARSFTFHPGRRHSLNQLTWEDSHHLLGVLRAGSSWSVVRIGVDGTVEYAVPPTPAINEFSPFSLPIR